MRKQVGRQHRQLAREKSAKMSYFLTVVVVLLALSQQLHAIAAEGYRHDSAQYLYMERLRQATRSIADDDGENGAVNPGTLLATSFKDTCKHTLIYAATCSRAYSWHRKSHHARLCALRAL